MVLQTKEFKLRDLQAVEKEFYEKLGLDYEITDDGVDAFNATFFDIETRSEIKIIASIEEKFGATDY